jgi:hypothetical protein
VSGQRYASLRYILELENTLNSKMARRFNRIYVVILAFTLLISIIVAITAGPSFGRTAWVNMLFLFSANLVGVSSAVNNVTPVAPTMLHDAPADDVQLPVAWYTSSSITVAQVRRSFSHQPVSQSRVSHQSVGRSVGRSAPNKQQAGWSLSRGRRRGRGRGVDGPTSCPLSVEAGLLPIEVEVEKRPFRKGRQILGCLSLVWCHSSSACLTCLIASDPFLLTSHLSGCCSMWRDDAM